MKKSLVFWVAPWLLPNLMDVSNSFNIFCSGEGKGGSGFC